MPEYRRMFAPGGTFFLTFVTYERRRIFADPSTVALLRNATATVKHDQPFEILGAVILPDHVHFLWELPSNDTDFSTRIGKIKAAFTRAFREAGGQTHTSSASRQRHRESGVWQRRFWEHTIRDEHDFGTHMDYIHYNPVKHGLSTCPHNYPYSSFHRWVRERVYDADRCCACDGRNPEPPRFDQVAGAGE